MMKDLFVLFAIGLLLFVLARWAITPFANVSGPKTLMIIITGLGITLSFIAVIEVFARYQASQRLSIASQTGFDPGFHRYLQAYKQALPPGVNQQAVRQMLAGYHRRFEEQLNGRLTEYYVFRYGFLGRPVIEVEYDNVGDLVLIQEGYLD